MALLNDILKWTESLPKWQRDAARRLFLNESGLSDADLRELYILLKQENGIECNSSITSIPLASEHLPVETAVGAKVALLSMYDLENVNLIPNGQTLKFSEVGITVIYGGNGSGKSGYARVLKQACRARDQSEIIHPNAYDPNAAKNVPSAKFVLKTADGASEVVWSRDTTSPSLLSAIAVFDSRCARSYVTSEKEAAYLPYGLDIVQNLADQVLPRLTELLDAELATIDTDTHSLDHLLGDTEVGRMIEGLSADSDPMTISSLGSLSESDIRRLHDLGRVLSESDPMAKAEEYRLSAMRLKSYSEKLVGASNWVGSATATKLKQLHEEKTVAETAELRASQTLQAGEVMLPETGGAAWKILFEAARRYSNEAAYPDMEFPASTEGKVCPLCQEELRSAGYDRLKRFDEYIRNDVAKTAEEARRKIEEAKYQLERLDTRVMPEEALRDELLALDSSLIETIKSYQEVLELRRTGLLQCLSDASWDELPVFIDAPRHRIRGLAAQQLRHYRTLVRAADDQKRHQLLTEHKELAAREELARNLNTVVSLVRRMKEKAALEKCRPSLKTRPISEKSKEFASVAVTEELRKSLDYEFNVLGISHIRTRLKERGDRGKILHQLVLDLPTTAKIDEILSEGEQRAVALGSFFAELSLSNHSCGIVFDDPVSSLDHWRRQNVARRLVAEATKRQVIVFTHDTAFLGQLSDEIEAASISSAMMFLEWHGSSPGFVNSGLPWDHQGYKERIDSLEQAQKKLAKSWPAYPGENDKADMRQQYDRLRATIERVIQDVVFNGVVKRYRDWIRVDSLEEVVGFAHTEYDAIQKLHKRSCEIVTGHDPASAKSAAVPSADDLGKDIAQLKTIVDLIKTRRKNVKAAP